MKQMRNKKKKGYFLDLVAFTIVFSLLYAIAIPRLLRIKISNPSESTGSVKINCDSPDWKKKPICN